MMKCKLIFPTDTTAKCLNNCLKTLFLPKTLAHYCIYDHKPSPKTKYETLLILSALTQSKRLHRDKEVAKATVNALRWCLFFEVSVLDLLFRMIRLQQIA